MSAFLARWRRRHLAYGYLDDRWLRTYLERVNR